jgi:hypothetical protein
MVQPCASGMALDLSQIHLAASDGDHGAFAFRPSVCLFLQDLDHFDPFDVLHVAPCPELGQENLSSMQWARLDGGNGYE